MADSGRPHHIDPEDDILQKSILSQTTKTDASYTEDVNLQDTHTNIHTGSIVTPSKSRISILPYQLSPSSKYKLKNVGMWKIPRKKSMLSCPDKIECPVIVETTPSSQNAQTPNPIFPEDRWKTVWDKLKSSGWTWGQGNGLISYYYYPPGKSQPIGRDGIDYFTSEEAVKDFVKKKYNWIGEQNKYERRGRRRKQDSLELSEKKLKHSSSSKEKKSFKLKSKRKISKEKSIKSSNSGRIWEEITDEKQTEHNKKNMSKVSLTPKVNMGKAQNSSNPIVSSSSENSIDSFTRYRWKNLWADLKMEGWTVVRASKYNNLHDWYYMKPNCDPALPQFELGRDYFQFEEDVIDCIRKLDKEKRAKKKRVIPDSISLKAINNSETHESNRRNTVISEFDEEAAVENSVIEGSICTPENKRTPTLSSSVIPESECWWLYEAIPKSLQVWRTLSKLGFKYSSGMYCLPGVRKGHLEPGINAFTDQRDLAKFLSAEGIPNLMSEDGESNLNRTDEEYLLKWVSVAHLPTGINSINSLSMLSAVPILSDFEAWNILHQKLRYSFEAGNYFLPLKVKDAFHTLEDLKSHIGGHGLQVDKILQKSMKKNLELLGVIMWASRAPLPEHKQKAKLDCYVKKNKASTNVQSKVNQNDIAKNQRESESKDEKRIIELTSHDESNDNAKDASEKECGKLSEGLEIIENNPPLATLEKSNTQTNTEEDNIASLDESLQEKDMTVTIDKTSQMDEVSSLEKHRNSSFSENSVQSEGNEVYHDTVQTKRTPNISMEEGKVEDECREKDLCVGYEDAIEALREEERKNDLHYQMSLTLEREGKDETRNESYLVNKQNDVMQGHSFFFTQPLQDDKDVCDGRVDHGYPWL